MEPGGVREIQLTQGRAALVDEADFDRLNASKWRLHGGGYAFRRRPGGNGSQLFMHRAVIGDPPSGMVVDHINGDKLDNRRANLRFCTQAENTRNRKPPTRIRSGKHATIFIGVCFLPRLNKYRGGVMCGGRVSNTACFCTAIGAALARDALARDLHGEFASLNFPDLNIAWEWRPHSQPKTSRVSKLSPHWAEIQGRCAAGESRASIAAAFGCTAAAVGMIVARKRGLDVCGQVRLMATPRSSSTRGP